MSQVAGSWLPARRAQTASVGRTRERETPAVPALAVGAGTWLVLTVRFDLVPRIRRWPL